MNPINLLLPWLASWACLLAVCMLILSCNALWWVIWACKVAFTFFVPFWLMISKRLLFYEFSRFMQCLCFLWYVPVAYCFLALNIASWCYFWHVSIFTKSMKLISFALLPCFFEPSLFWFSRISVFMFCQASWVDHYHMLCCYVGV